MSDEQKQKIEPIVEQARNDRLALRRGQQSASESTPKSGQSRLLEFQERPKRIAAWEEKAKASWTEISKILTKEQAQRLDQIAVQWDGVRVLWNENEEVASALELTDEQRKELTAIKLDLAKRRDELGRGNEEKQAELEKELVDKCMAVLNDEQRAQFAEMQGEKLTLQGPAGLERRKAQPE